MGGSGRAGERLGSDLFKSRRAQKDARRDDNGVRRQWPSGIFEVRRPATSAATWSAARGGVDKQGNVYIVDGNADGVRKVDELERSERSPELGLRGFRGRVRRLRRGLDTPTGRQSTELETSTSLICRIFCVRKANLAGLLRRSPAGLVAGQRRPGDLAGGQLHGGAVDGQGKSTQPMASTIGRGRSGRQGPSPCSPGRCWGLFRGHAPANGTTVRPGVARTDRTQHRPCPERPGAQGHEWRSPTVSVGGNGARQPCARPVLITIIGQGNRPALAASETVTHLPGGNPPHRPQPRATAKLQEDEHDGFESPAS